MKKYLVILLGAIMIAALCTSCTSGSTSSTTTPTTVNATEIATTEPEATNTEAEILPLRYYMPGAASQQADSVNEAISEKLQEDGLNIDFQPMYIAWDQWVDKINMMLSTGDEFEMLHIMFDYIPASIYTGRGALTPLDDLINEYTPGLWDLFEDILWSCATVNGDVMSVPAYWRDNSGDFEGYFSYCVTRFEKYGLTVPTTIEDLIDTMVELQAYQEEETGMTAYIYEHSTGRCPIALHRTYDTWPYYTSADGIFMVTQDGTASLFFESEDFKQDCEFMNECYTLGLIHPDILNLSLDTIATYKSDGDYLLGIQTGGTDVTDNAGNVVLDFDYFMLNPDAPYLCNMPLLNSNGIPSTCKHPEVSLQFLYWMYTNAENQNLVLYGIEGEHWNAVGENEYQRIKDENDSNLYNFAAWMIEYVPLHLFDVERTTTPKEDLDYISNLYPENTVYSPICGFNFNIESVNVEYANMLAEYTTSILPIKEGVIPYEGNYEAAIEKMKAAGCDAVIEEFQRQLNEYLASKE